MTMTRNWPPRRADDNQFEPGRGRATRQCEVDGCNTTTREGKSHCTKHVLDMGYARGVFEIENRTRAEVEKVEAHGKKAVDLNGLVVEEIITGIVERHNITWRRLVKDRVNYLMRVKQETADRFLERLIDEGIVTTTTNRRRMIIPRLTHKGMATRAALKALSGVADD